MVSFQVPHQDNDKRVSAEITQQLQREFKEMFNKIGCFDGMFSLQLKPGNKPYQAPLRLCGLYALQKPVQRGVGMTPKARHHSTTRSG